MFTRMIEKLVRYLKRRREIRFRKYCIKCAIRACKGSDGRYTADVAKELHLFMNRIFPWQEE